MSIISKELLSEVLGVYVRDGWYFDCELLIYTNDKILGLDENYHSQINIYELAHKCKEWAISKGWVLHEVRNLKEYIIYFSGDFREPSNDFRADTEHEAIFQACEWILKESK